jgi:hypothetical protein
MTASVACLMLGNWAMATCEGIIGARRIVTIRRSHVTYEKTNGEFVQLTLRDDAERAFRANKQLCDIKAS